MIKRIFGGILLFVGISGMALAAAGVRLGRQAVDSLGQTTLDSLTLLGDTLATVEDTLLLAKQTVDDVNTSLDTVSDTAVSVSQTVRQTKPLLGQVSTVVGEEVPDSLESLETAVPDIVAVAGAIDDTLTTLNNFRIDRSILGIPLQFDLGITYQPEQPFDETVAVLGDSIAVLPDQLRSLDIFLTVTSNNLDTISQDLNRLASDLQDVNGRISELNPLLDEYLALTTRLADQNRLVRAQIESQLANLKTAVLIVSVWFGLTQLTTLYLGWELLTNRRYND
ncbi:MAG: hypothetical protein Kow0080_06950 [Candidatus Promineifilaceae bacterium]